MTAVQEVDVELASERRVTKRDLVKGWLLWTFFSHANYNYERLQATGVAHAMSPVIKRLYGGDEAAMRAAMQRHLVFFNTDPVIGGSIHGATIAMEEQKANGRDLSDDGINSVKTGLMGPLAGVGDSIIQGTIVPILIALGIGIAGVSAERGEQVNLDALSGNVAGPMVYVVLVLAALLALAYFAWMQGYYRGRSVVLSIFKSGLLNRFMLGASVLGNVVLGGLAATFVVFSVAPTVDVGGSSVALQRDVLDRIMPGLLPLALILLTWWLLRRGWHPVRLLAIYLAISIITAYPFFGAAPQAVNDPAACESSVLQHSPCQAPDEPDR